MKLTTNTKMQIGYKFEVALANGSKIMAANGRQIMVTLSNDLYNIYAFTLRGVKITKEVKIEGLYADQLNNEIVKAALQ